MEDCYFISFCPGYKSFSVRVVVSVSPVLMMTVKVSYEDVRLVAVSRCEI